jgi:tRNA-specific 2-thiouridylase
LKVSNRKKNNKVLVALSGGVDSAVSAALLLEQGYTVEAAFMKNWSKTEGLLSNECPWLEDRRDALRVAAHLDIPLHTFDFEDAYAERVMGYFFAEYQAGRTPNPDVMCNKEIKFKLLYDKAIELGFDYLATGHYAQIKNGKLLRSKDEFKDQTYFIYNIARRQLDHILFPVGCYTKPEIRALAKKFKLPNADRKESMGLCFVGKIRLDDFLKQKVAAKEGDILDASGTVIGQHQGTSFYTLGQRQGLHIGGSGPYYVIAKDIARNTITVSKDPEDAALMSGSVAISGTHWIDKPHSFPAALKVRFRHQQELLDAVIAEEGSDRYSVHFTHPQRAAVSGQSLVMYEGQECRGGGILV